jgi:anaphase-promoting complex subunit 1
LFSTRRHETYQMNSEHETLREQQNTLVRTSERTQALPYGRAMFTFGTISSLNRESFIIPKMEYSIRLVPPNTTIGPEMNRIPKASVEWGEFHNGVAAGLRIVPTAKGVESSWIAFNKPSELTSQHAGFLMALGLTGHLKGMLTWQTFGYLTPKHEQTSIGVLLGLSAAHVGSGDEHVTKLLAVHAPALLPHREVDLNVPLITQTAALAGIGLLYMGTKKRHMAEVLLNEIQRKDLTQPDLTNDHREAYTLASGIAFGMVMLARGTNIPSDNDLVERLRMLIHGQPPTGSSQAPSFDMTLTSPAATIAISLMFLRTERVDIADILALPDATLELHRIQPAMLLVRALGKALIMWDSIEASPGWIESQVPPQLIEAMNAHIEGKTVDDTLELAYLNIIAGACFALALKTAGSHSPAAHRCVFASYVHFSKITSFSGT